MLTLREFCNVNMKTIATPKRRCVVVREGRTDSRRKAMHVKACMSTLLQLVWKHAGTGSRSSPVPRTSESRRQGQTRRTVLLLRCRREAELVQNCTALSGLAMLHIFCHIQDLRPDPNYVISRTRSDAAACGPDDGSAEADEGAAVMGSSEAAMDEVSTTPEESKEESMVSLLEGPWDPSAASNEETESEWASDSEQESESAASDAGTTVESSDGAGASDDERPVKRQRTAGGYYSTEQGKCANHGGGMRCSRQGCSTMTHCNGLCFRHGSISECSVGASFCRRSCKHFVQWNSSCRVFILQFAQ